MAEEESANDPQLLGLIRLGRDTTVFIFWPIWIGVSTVVYYVTFGLLFVLKLLWQPLEFLLLPVFYLGDFILTCLLAPFRFLAKFETLYIYLGIAALLGVAGGFIISLISGGLQSLLGLDSKAEPEGRSIQDFRKSRGRRGTGSDASSTPSVPDELSQNRYGTKSLKKRRKSGKPSEPPTILEELDSDY